MGMFNEYPYRNLTDLNLDYIFKIMKEVEKQVEYFVSLNAIKYADPIQWDITRQYEKNTIVIDPLTGTAYISVAPVPAGTALTRTEYWTVVFDLQRFVTKACKNFTSRYEAETTTTATFNTPKDGWLCWADVLYKANVNITAGDSYVPGGNITAFTMEDFGGHLDDLLTTDKTNVVAAINELVNVLIQMSVEIGDLDDLTTVDKTSIVNAINELVTEISNVILTIGDLNDLTTIDKTSVVNAINELVSALTTTNNNIGDLNDLNTSDKSSIVNAINDITSIIPNAPYVTPQDFGAVGDGVTDDYQAFVDALAEDAMLIIPAGSYFLSATLTIPSFKVISGQAIDKTILYFDGSNGINLGNNRMITIANLDVLNKSNNKTYNGIIIGNTRSLRIIDVIISGFDKCISFEPTNISFDNYFHNVRCQEGNTGISAQTNYDQVDGIFELVSTDNCTQSILIYGFTGTMTSCRFGIQSTGAGIKYSYGSHVIFNDCDFEAEYTSGLSNTNLFDFSDGSVTFNECKFQGNSLLDSSCYAIKVNSGRTVTINGGVFRGLTGVANCIYLDSLNSATRCGGIIVNSHELRDWYENLKTTLPNRLYYVKMYNTDCLLRNSSYINTTEMTTGQVFFNISTDTYEIFDGTNLRPISIT